MLSIREKRQMPVLPIENTTAGLIQPVWDRLLEINPGPPLAARAEARVRIGFVAAALPGSKGKIQKILAHPVAETQCHRFIQRSGWAVVPCHDTAGAARLVREANDPSQAALCPLPAARVHGLEVLDTDCGDSSRTWTRFLLLEHGTAVPGPDDDRSILIFSLKDIPGALVETLACFARQGLNLAAIHSRAVPGHPGQYRFLVELRVGAGDPKNLTALKDLQRGSDGHTFAWKLPNAAVAGSHLREIVAVVKCHTFAVPSRKWKTHMNEEQLQRAIEFLTQSQADSVAQNAIIRENFKELQAKQDSLDETVRNLALMCRDLLEVEQIHSRRLDRLEGIQPH